MNKSIKLVTEILLIIIIVAGVIFYIAHSRVMDSTNKINTDIGTTNNVQQTEEKVGRAIMVNGKIYYDTGKQSTELRRCGVMDGKITSNINFTEIPTIDNQANFEGEYSYQYGKENTIEVLINNEWCIFETKEEQEDKHSFCGKVVEVGQRHIIVEPNEGEAIRRSADKISITLDEENDEIYEIGTNVKITYTGYVMETYPAKVEAVKVELNTANDFEIRFYDKHPQTDNKIQKILDRTENNKYDYDIYTYDGSANILINGEEISLRNALLDNKITMDKIIEKANQDLSEKDIYKDGGSMIYKYPNFTIIKCHTLDGNKDVYIGVKGMTINDVK